MCAHFSNFKMSSQNISNWGIDIDSTMPYYIPRLFFIRRKNMKTSIAFVLVCFLTGIFYICKNSPNVQFTGALTNSLCSIWCIAILGFIICNLYNGKKMENHQPSFMFFTLGDGVISFPSLFPGTLSTQA